MPPFVSFPGRSSAFHFTRSPNPHLLDGAKILAPPALFQTTAHEGAVFDPPPLWVSFPSVKRLSVKQRHEAFRILRGRGHVSPAGRILHIRPRYGHRADGGLVSALARGDGREQTMTPTTAASNNDKTRFMFSLP